VKRWVKALVAVAVVAVLIVVGIYIYFNMDEEVFKWYLVGVLTSAFMKFWHLGKPARIKINGEEGVVIA